MDDKFHNHIEALQTRYEEAFQYHGGVERLLICSGDESHYYRDDQAVPFRAFGHFCQWLPVDRPGQLLLIEPGRRPIYFQVTPPDYWYDQSIVNAAWWADEFDIVALSDRAQVTEQLGSTAGLAFVGEPTAFALALGIKGSLVNPDKLVDFLDYQRAYKTAYEIEQIRTANHKALPGHAAARECFLAGGSEYAIHMAFLKACEITESQCPYPSIVALNDRAAVLHYQNKRHRTDEDPVRGQVLLIDAGCRVNNYCSDITRTWTAPSCHAGFVNLVKGVDRVREQLVERVRPDLSYLSLHKDAMVLIGKLAVELELVNCGLDEALRLQLPGLFMPHGVGHLLGIQVHDVGGHLAAANGSRRPPPNAYPFLRNTRILAENMVFTIEPGFYFIPLLLDPERTTERGKHLNWSLIGELLPLGGVRCEDNVRVTAYGVENLTRQ
jgi:Xaa-Pro dipeptidase